MGSADYCAYYTSQMCGQFPVFRGGMQTGAGLGDILRGVLRFIAPIALRGISAFAGNTMAATRAGMPLGMAAKAALGPTLNAVAGSAAPTVHRFINAVIPGLLGNARKPAVVPARYGTAPEKASGEDIYSALGPGYDGDSSESQKGSGATHPALFDGVDGVPVTAKGARQYIKESGGSAPKASIATHKAPKRKAPASTKNIHYNF